MKASYDLLFLGLLIAGVACARMSESAPASPQAKAPPPPSAAAPASTEIRADIGKLFGSLRSLDDATPEAIGRALNRKLGPHPDIRRAAQWSGPLECGARLIEVVPAASGGGVSVALNAPSRAADAEGGACCSLRLRELADDLDRLGYRARLSDILDRKKTWFFEPVQPKEGFAVQAQAWTEPEATDGNDRDVCVDRLDIRMGPGT